MNLFCEDVGMQFGIKKCGKLIMEKGKVVRTDVVRLPNRQDMKDIVVHT